MYADILDSEEKPKLQLQSGISLLQTTFTDLDEEGRQINPRDRDQQDMYFNARLLSNPFPKLATKIYMSVSRSEFVSISSQFSQNNRSQLTYDFRPELTYSLTERIEIKQTYGLNIEFTDQFFEREGTVDVLDRNITFANDVKVKLSDRLNITVIYTLLLHDRGSFLPQDETDDSSVNARVFDVQNEDRHDQMDIRFNYRLMKHVSLVGANRYSKRVDTFVNSGLENTFTDGAIELGARGSYRWGGGRQLTFHMIRVKQFGNFSRPEQKDYWRMNAEMSYAF